MGKKAKVGESVKIPGGLAHVKPKKGDNSGRAAIRSNETGPGQDAHTKTPASGKSPNKPGGGSLSTLQAADVAKVPADKDLSKIGTSFKKHNHAKYGQKIKKCAKDLVNLKPTCKFARMCQDETTEQWNLNLYYFKGKNYVLAAYDWDPVDEKWKEACKPIKQPMSHWKSHLEFSAVGKKCAIIKGSAP
jgi:hypothetical protein